jgi:hypothetical protein
MPSRISEDHPIRGLFHSLVERACRSHLGAGRPEVARYLGDVLVDFTHRDQIFRIRDARGRPLEEVGEMLVEGDVALNATSFEREREVHKHIGDYTLFWTGVYPEMLRCLRAASRRDHLIDYVEQGRRSYHIASTFAYGPYEDEAAVLRQLSDEFERCMLALQIVRRELETYGSPEMRAVCRLLDS